MSSRPESRQDAPQRGALQYDAFISYSRGNFEVAHKFERDLETFPLPRDIRKRLGRRQLNIFRDISDLTGNRLETGGRRSKTAAALGVRAPTVVPDHR